MFRPGVRYGAQNSFRASVTKIQLVASLVYRRDSAQGGELDEPQMSSARLHALARRRGCSCAGGHHSTHELIAGCGHAVRAVDDLVAGELIAYTHKTAQHKQRINILLL